jgi:Tfp pilus assembly protein PilV
MKKLIGLSLVVLFASMFVMSTGAMALTPLQIQAMLQARYAQLAQAAQNQQTVAKKVNSSRGQ